MEPDGEIQFTPDSALPDIRVLAISVTVDEDGDRLVDLHTEDFYEDEVLGLLRWAQARIEALVAVSALEEADEDED